MFKLFKINDLIDDKNEDVLLINLLQKNNAELKLAYLKKHQEMRPYNTNTNECIYVIDGEIELVFNNEEYSCNSFSCNLDSQEKQKELTKNKIKKHQLFLTEKELIHSITALKNSTFLIIKI
jgi:hypothetical protein